MTDECLSVVRRRALEATVTSLLMMLAIPLVGESPLAAQETEMVDEPSGSAAVAGTVTSRETGEPVSQALVAIPELGLGTFADEDGFYAMDDLPPGTYDIEVRFLDRTTRRAEVQLIAENVNRLDFTVQSEPAELPELQVSVERPIPRGKLAGFHQRKATHTGGLFITRDDLDRQNVRRMSQLFRGLPGVNVVRLPGATMGHRVEIARGIRSLSGTRICPVKFYLDGARVSVQPDEDIDTFMDPDQIEAVEVYRSAAEIPPRFSGTDAGCGVIVIWTRTGRD